MVEIFPLTKPKRDIRIPETVSPAVIKTCLRATPLNMKSNAIRKPKTSRSLEAKIRRYPTSLIGFFRQLCGFKKRKLSYVL
jgi:hypothetical protein